jgi:hypothetical protein
VAIRTEKPDRSLDRDGDPAIGEPCRVVDVLPLLLRVVLVGAEDGEGGGIDLPTASCWPLGCTRRDGHGVGSATACLLRGGTACRERQRDQERREAGARGCHRKILVRARGRMGLWWRGAMN